MLRLLDHWITIQLVIEYNWIALSHLQTTSPGVFRRTAVRQEKLAQVAMAAKKWYAALGLSGKGLVRLGAQLPQTFSFRPLKQLVLYLDVQLHVCDPSQSSQSTMSDVLASKCQKAHSDTLAVCCTFGRRFWSLVGRLYQSARGVSTATNDSGKCQPPKKKSRLATEGWYLKQTVVISFQTGCKKK
jgi:hypothetical protein